MHVSKNDETYRTCSSNEANYPPCNMFGQTVKVDIYALTEAVIVTIALVLGGILLRLLFLLLVDPESGDNAIEEVAEIDQNDHKGNGHPPSPAEHAKSWNDESRAKVGNKVGCDMQ